MSVGTGWWVTGDGEHCITRGTSLLHPNSGSQHLHPECMPGHVTITILMKPAILPPPVVSEGLSTRSVLSLSTRPAHGGGGAGPCPERAGAASLPGVQMRD